MLTRVRARITVTGIVQGVGFRASAQEVGRRLGLAGWVRNVPNGCVEAVCEGDTQQVEQFVQWCKKGPSLARVDEVSVEYEPPTGDLDSFYVR